MSSMPADIANLGVAAVAVWALSQAVAKLVEVVKGKSGVKSEGEAFGQAIGAIQEFTRTVTQLYTHLTVRDQDDKEWKARQTQVMDNLVRSSQQTVDRLELLTDEVRRSMR